MDIQEIEQGEAQDLLPEEIRDMLALAKAKVQEKKEALGKIVSSKRDEAVKGRQASGIEEVWAEDEDAYQGIDDANRDTAKAYKPMSVTGTPTFSTRRNDDDNRSTILLNITRPYVDAASARVGDMLLPTDDRNWAIKPSPLAQEVQPPQMPSAGLTGQPPLPSAGPLPPTGAPPGSAPMAPMSAPPVPVDPQEAIQKAARVAAEKAQQQIEDWHVECQYHAEMRKVIEDCSRLGTGILKGPFPVKKKKMAVLNAEGGTEIVMEEKINPASKRVDPWRFYPDPACGEDIHSGSYVFEQDDISGRKLRDLKGIPGYDDTQIDKVLEEGPGKKYIQAGKAPSVYEVDCDTFDIWYFHGDLNKDDLDGIQIAGLKEADIPDVVHAVITLVNDCPIKVHLNPLDEGDYPYDVMPWQRRAGHWAGIGVARQIRAPQKMITSATRNMMDNAGISGGPILGIRQNAVRPMDGKWNLSPRKQYWINENAEVRSIKEAIDAIIIPSNQPEMVNIIQFALQMAEQVTGMPLMMQGMQGSAPDTFGGQQLFQNNASTVLRRIARNYDDYITEPHIRRYYAYLMESGEDDSMKGDFIIDARGSSALVEREIQNQQIMQMGNLVGNPAFGLSPRKWMTEFLKSQRLDPDRFEMDDDEKKALAQQQPPMAPQVQAAQIRAQVDLKRTEMQNNALLQRAKMDQDRDTVYVQAETRRDQINAVMRKEELLLKREIAFLTLQIQKGISVDDNKVKLAETAMKLRTQRELAFANTAADLHKHRNPTPQVATPAVEPPGRAQPGQAFQQ